MYKLVCKILTQITNFVCSSNNGMQKKKTNLSGELSRSETLCDHFNCHSFIFFHLSSHNTWLCSLSLHRWTQSYSVCIQLFNSSTVCPCRSQWSSGGAPGYPSLNHAISGGVHCIGHCNTPVPSWAWAAAPFLLCLGQLSLLPSMGW